MLTHFSRPRWSNYWVTSMGLSNSFIAFMRQLAEGADGTRRGA